MKAKLIWLVLGFLILAITAAVAFHAFAPKKISGQNGLPAQSLTLGLSEGFARAFTPIKLNFPKDHGSHDEYQTEWWYYTGNLTADGGRKFGYQLTFFRRALVPPGQREERPSTWATDQVYFAHLALSDIQSKEFFAYERFSRGAAGLAGAVGTPHFSVWLDHWQVEQVNDHIFHLRASQGEITLDLELNDLKGPALQGQDGLSQKGSEPGNASYYISLPRLAASGEVQVGGVAYEVEGLSWMDHEFGTSALGKDQVGWDWFALQLDDGSELMLFTLRRADGSIDSYSSGVLIEPDGSMRRLESGKFDIEIGDYWTSPHSGAKYPAGWTILIPEEGIELTVAPQMADQELRLTFTYWEGAVRVEGSKGGRPVSGVGYVELTGYASSMQGQF